MDSVTVREASERLESLLEQAERGEEVVITRDGVPVARLVAEPKAGRRVLTAEQRQALDESQAWLRQPRTVEPWTFNRDELYEDRG